MINVITTVKNVTLINWVRFLPVITYNFSLKYSEVYTQLRKNHLISTRVQKYGFSVVGRHVKNIPNREQPCVK